MHIFDGLVLGCPPSFTTDEYVGISLSRLLLCDLVAYNLCAAERGLISVVLIPSGRPVW